MLRDNDRHSIRLRTYDYSSPGAYFVTLCAQDRICWFGKVRAGVVNLNDYGTMVDRWWRALPGKFPSLRLDEFLIMPNHIHGILWIKGPPLGQPHISASLSKMIQWFKTMSTNDWIRNVNDVGWRRFRGKVWQRNYYEHIIRDDRELFNIRNYIRANPMLWPVDRDNAEHSEEELGSVQAAAAESLGLTMEQIISAINDAEVGADPRVRPGVSEGK